MINKKVDILIIGAGPAGMAAAYYAKKQDKSKKVLIVEREEELGGILKQCIHNGFGIHYFKEELTGPEYAGRFIDMVNEEEIEVLLNTMILSLNENKAYAVNKKDGEITIESKAIILAMGCRERTRGAIMIPGSRPAGVYTAGMAQKIVNMKGELVGKNVVILGSGDIGLIMARRMTFEGANVKMVLELQPYSTGLKRNIRQCLDDFDIPLKLSHTVTEIHGDKRLSAVTIAEVDENYKIKEETKQKIECDTLLLSVGLIPENDLVTDGLLSLDKKTKGVFVDQNRKTIKEGIFSCGNVLHVHDLVDYVTKEGEIAGRRAADYVNEEKWPDEYANVETGDGVLYTVPQLIDVKDKDDKTEIYFRSNQIYEDVDIIVESANSIMYKERYKKISPGEMESIKINTKDIKKNDTIKLYIAKGEY